MVSPNGRIKGVFVEHGDGEFFRYPSNHFRTDGNDVVLMSPINLRARTLCEELPLIYRKDQALSGLLEKKRISSEMFNNIHKSFENALNQLKTDAQNILENIDKHIVRCNQQIKELRLVMMHLEIERAIGKIDEKSYQTAMEIIQEGLKRAEAEKSDLEATRNKLSNMLSEGKAQTETESALMLPEPPLVVHVKNHRREECAQHAKDSGDEETDVERHDYFFGNRHSRVKVFHGYVVRAKSITECASCARAIPN